MFHHIPLRQKIITMLAVMSALFLVALDQTIVSTALSAIVTEFNSYSSLSWVVTAYLLGSTVTVPIAGKLSDLFGRRKILLIGVAIFIITSLLSGSATTITQLIWARALQGVGGGIVMANAFTIIGDLFSPRERGRWQGLIGASFAIASVAGPLLGGYLTDAHYIFGLETNWRWNFWLNVPIGLVAYFLIWRFSPKIKHDHKPIVDYFGASALTIALSGIILAVDNTEKIFADVIASGYSLEFVRTSLIVISVVAAGLFVWIETKAKEPIIPLNFFKNRTFTAIMVVATLFGVAFLGAIIYLTQFNMQVYGADATTAGLMLLPMIGTVTIISAVTGNLVTKTGKYKSFFVGGLSVTTLSVLALTFLTADSPYWHEAIIMAFVGAGMGTGMPIMNLAVQNEFAQRDLGVATASSQLFRGLGSTIGIAVYGAMLSSGLNSSFNLVIENPQIVSYLEEIKTLPQGKDLIGNNSADDIFNLNTPDTKALIIEKIDKELTDSNIVSQEKENLLADFSEKQTEFSREIAVAYADSLRPLFATSAGVMVVAVFFASLIREKKLEDSPEAPGVVA